MECKSRVIANVVLLQVEGRIDHTTVESLRKRVVTTLGRLHGGREKVAVGLRWVGLHQQRRPGCAYDRG